MKQKLLWIALAVGMLCTACNREARQLLGDYSYKLSGEVVVVDDAGKETHHFVHRNGQMNVLRDKSSKSRFVVTMNEMNGGCCTFSAELNGDSLVLQPYAFTMTIISTEGIDFPNLNQEESPNIVYSVTASGSGWVNGNTLIVKEVWTGQQSGNPSVTLRASEMMILAEKN